ncbi:MAG: hypothetical protein CMB46_00515 [Euryarchaeota archaeon]|nr:hypothetical protein [Euryarchaeota archaeon]|tara:strand:+ start:236 stop:2377 length:2142 start_codon:yes stop_codon:yes gene_type:complete
MEGARAALLSLILTTSIVFFGYPALAEDGGSTVLIEGTSERSGPAWLVAECVEISCPGLELVVMYDGSEQVITDQHRVQWSGPFENNLSWKVNADEEVNLADIMFDTIFPIEESLVETDDLEEIVPLPGDQDGSFELDATSICQLSRCNSLDVAPIASVFVGSLEDADDMDSFRILGDNGDIVVIDDFRGRGVIDLEIWESSAESKSLIDVLSSENELPIILDYPTDSSLWLRVAHPTDSGYSPYEISLSRFDDQSEAPEGGELGGEWDHGGHLGFGSGPYFGHISGFDVDGDSLLLQAGSKMDISPICIFSGEVLIDILVQTVNGSYFIDEETDSCPELIVTPADAFSLEFRFRSNIAISWSIDISSDSINDGKMIGDAPDYLWGESGPWDHHEHVLPGPLELSGTLGPGDNVDVHIFSIEDENGSRVYLRDSGSSPVSFQIQSLDQNNWNIMNYTNGSMISVPNGLHALRVESLSSSDVKVEYGFTLFYAGEDIPDDAELSDLSYLFNDLYIFLGAIMIVPLAVVIWWERKRLFSRTKGSEIIEAHERRRLRRLRERLSKEISQSEIDERVVESALHQLGDSPWSGIISEWGSPLIRHMTDQIEVCAWRVEMGSSLILGIRVGPEDWKMAAIRLHSPEGSLVGIDNVSPKHLFRGDEIFLDTLESGSRTFIRMSIEGNPSVLTFQLSGLVGGEPVAAAPRSAIDWQSLESE